MTFINRKKCSEPIVITQTSHYKSVILLKFGNCWFNVAATRYFEALLVQFCSYCLELHWNIEYKASAQVTYHITSTNTRDHDLL